MKTQTAPNKQKIANLAQTTAPKCPYFGRCGGCQLQHLDNESQTETKENELKEILLQKLSEIPRAALPVLSSEPWHYRYRASFSAKLINKKGGVLVGFREKKKKYVTDMETCLIVPEAISGLIRPLRDLLTGLSIPNAVPQIGVVCGEEKNSLVLRHLKPLTGSDHDQLIDFEKKYGINFYLQPRGYETIHPLDPSCLCKPSYRLPEFGLEFEFHPSHFTQINPEVNRLMTSRVVELLNPQPNEKIADMFCGIGNFSLPIASRGAHVVGFEFNESQVETARENAVRNQLEAFAQFHTVDLSENIPDLLGGFMPINKMVIDPPRSGAENVVRAIEGNDIRKIVYVSCNPETLARDAKILTQELGYQFRAYGLIDMFPQTEKIEAMAVFERSQ